MGLISASRPFPFTSWTPETAPFFQDSVHLLFLGFFGNISCLFLKSRSVLNQFGLSPSSHSEQQEPIYLRSWQRWLPVRPHDNVPILNNLRHLYLPSARSHVIQRLCDGLQKANKQIRKSGSLKTKLAQLLPFIAEAVEPLFVINVPHVL